jgi:ketosteroid isomerase-like protein
MLHEDNKQLVRDFLDVMYQTTPEAPWHTSQRIHELIDSKEFEWKLIGSTPSSGIHKGWEAVQRGFFGPVGLGDGRGGGAQGVDLSFTPVFRPESIEALEDGRVIYLGNANLRGKNGKPYFNEYCWIFTIKNGRITRLLEFCDTVMLETVMFDKRLVPAEELTPNQLSRF